MEKMEGWKKQVGSTAALARQMAMSTVVHVCQSRAGGTMLVPGHRFFFFFHVGFIVYGGRAYMRHYLF